LVNLKKLAQQFQRQESAGAADEDEDDVPDLVEGESFEEASKQEAIA
jgi:nascent polypeptide-associated complex subunit beta